LPEGDEIVYLDTGNVVAQGGFKKLVKSNDRFKALMDEHGIFATKVKKEEKAAKVEQDNAAHSNEGTQYEAEDKEQGAVAFKIYGYYLKNAGLANTFIVMIMFILQVLFLFFACSFVMSAELLFRLALKSPCSGGCSIGPRTTSSV